MIDSIVNLGKAFVALDKNIEYNDINSLNFKEIVQYFSNPPFNLNNFIEAKEKDYKFPNIFFIEFKTIDDNVNFVGISKEIYRQEYDDKVLNFPARGGVYSTPTLKIIPKGKKSDNIKKKIENGIENSLNHIKKYFKKFEKNKKYKNYILLNKINQVLIDNYSIIRQQLFEKQIDIFPSKTKIGTGINSLLSIKIDDKLPYEIGEVVEVFNDKLMSDYGFKNLIDINICSLCHDKNSEKLISGNFSPFSFYTSDKKGYIAGGFNKKLVHLNYPVCKKCALYALIGANLLKTQFTFKLGGINFYLIPRMLILEENMREFLFQFDDIKNKLLTRKISYEQFAQGENLILDVLSKFNDSIVFNFLFYELSGPGKSVFNILLLIQDISPSRIQKINDEINNVDNFERSPLFPGVNADKFPMIFSFRNLRNLFYNRNLRYFDRDRYLQTLWMLFTGKDITFKRLITFFFKKLKDNLHLNNKSTFNLSYDIKNFIPIILLFGKLNQLII